MDEFGIQEPQVGGLPCSQGRARRPSSALAQAIGLGMALKQTGRQLQKSAGAVPLQVLALANVGQFVLLICFALFTVLALVLALWRGRINAHVDSHGGRQAAGDAGAGCHTYC
jgi:hypothetical protein